MNKIRYNAVVVHYSEIALKGENRPYFEKILIQNIENALDKKGYTTIERNYGTVILNLTGDANIPAISETLKCIPGISSYAPAVRTTTSIDDIKKYSLDFATIHKKRSFKIDTKRSDKTFTIKSLDLNEEIGSFIVEKTGMKVKLKEPGLVIYIELINKQAYLYHEKQAGIGGLPVNSAGKLLCLLSGGIDSPVASYMLMKRGAHIVFVHFRNDTQTNSKSKIVDLVTTLTRFQNKSTLYIVDFKDIQKEIIKNVTSKIRMIIYRRFMFKIAEKILEQEQAKGFITGDSVAQVASQTLDNLQVIYEASHYPVFAPLIGMNKQETIDLAHKIGTYDISIQPYNDCCSFLIAQHPETKANHIMIQKAEEAIDFAQILELAKKHTERIVL